MALTDNLVGYWKLEETSGTRYDVTSNDHDLTDENTVGSGTGKIGIAASFVRTNNEKLYISDSLGIPNNGDITISAWFNLASLPAAASGKVYTIAGWSTTGAGNGYKNLAYGDYSGRKLFVQNNYDNICQYAIVLSTGVWYHLAFSMSAATAYACVLYFNGVAIGSQKGGGAPISSTMFSIGDEPYATANHFDGLIDEVGCWNRVLSANEIAALYNNGLGLSWPFLINVNTNFINMAY